MSQANIYPGYETTGRVELSAVERRFLFSLARCMDEQLFHISPGRERIVLEFSHRRRYLSGLDRESYNKRARELRNRGYVKREVIERENYQLRVITLSETGLEFIAENGPNNDRRKAA